MALPNVLFLADVLHVVMHEFTYDPPTPLTKIWRGVTIAPGKEFGVLLLSQMFKVLHNLASLRLSERC